MLKDQKWKTGQTILQYREAQKEYNTCDQWFQENEGQNKQAVSIIAYDIIFPTSWPQDH